MRVSFNGKNVQAGTSVQGKINKPIEMDSFSKNINNQIANAQKQLQELSEKKDMSVEEKMKKRQEIQQQITDLNNQLRQHQLEQRKEKQEKAAKSVEKKEPTKKGDKGKGLSQQCMNASTMQAIISADAAMSQAQVQGNVATRMEGRASVLKAEIKTDSANGGNVEAKQEELAKVQKKAVAAGASQSDILATVNRKFKVEENIAQKEDKEESKIKKAKGTKVAEEIVSRRAVYSHVDVRL